MKNATVSRKKLKSKDPLPNEAKRLWPKPWNHRARHMAPPTFTDLGFDCDSFSLVWRCSGKLGVVLPQPERAGEPFLNGCCSKYRFQQSLCLLVLRVFRWASAIQLESRGGMHLKLIPRHAEVTCKSFVLGPKPCSTPLVPQADLGF